MMMSHAFMPAVGLGMVGHILVLSGVVLLIAWAIKHLHGEKLRQAGLWCVVGGLVLCILSISLGMLMPKDRKMHMGKGSLEQGAMMERQ